MVICFSSNQEEKRTEERNLPIFLKDLLKHGGRPIW